MIGKNNFRILLEVMSDDKIRGKLRQIRVAQSLRKPVHLKTNKSNIFTYIGIEGGGLSRDDLIHTIKWSLSKINIYNPPSFIRDERNYKILEIRHNKMLKRGEYIDADIEILNPQVTVYLKACNISGMYFHDEA